MSGADSSSSSVETVGRTPPVEYIYERTFCGTFFVPRLPEVLILSRIDASKIKTHTERMFLVKSIDEYMNAIQPYTVYGSAVDRASAMNTISYWRSQKQYLLIRQDYPP